MLKRPSRKLLVPGKKIAVFGLLAVDWLLLIHLRAAGFLRPPHRAHVASTRGITRETEVQGIDIAIDGRLLLFGGHIRGLRIGDGAVEVNVWGWAVRLSLGLLAAAPAAEVCFSGQL